MRLFKALLLLGLILTPQLAFAHAGHNNGFTGGLIHPFTGLDHLLAMVAVGMLAAGVKEGRAVWFLPTAFVSALTVGGVLGLMKVSFGPVETVIALSVVVLGALVALRVSLPLVAGIILVAGFGLFHGLAHGLEAGARPVAFMIGMIISTAFLHFSGVAFVKKVQNSKAGLWAIRAIGSGMVAAGIFFLMG